MAEPRTLSEKIWESHVVRREPGQPDLLYIDLHLVHEVTSPQAFESLRMTGRKVAPPGAHDRDGRPRGRPTKDRNKSAGARFRFSRSTS